MLTATASVFILGYLLIIFESKLKIDKAVSSILMAVIMWIIIAMNFDMTSKDHAHELVSILGDTAAILFFLLAAMTMVELIDLNNGFNQLSRWITTQSKTLLLLTITLISFFFSAILDNLTTTIVMISIIRKIIADDTDRLWFASFIVIAANSGGAWSPIGDITTTMLWIENKVSSLSLIKNLFIPSIISIAIPVLIVAQFNRFRSRKLKLAHQSNRISATALFYLFLGIGLFIAVPILKMLTGLPPYLCIMGTMGVMWLISEIENPLLFPATTKTSRPTVQQALSRIEMPGILFFFGILLAVAALQFVGHLENLRTALDNQFENPAVIAFFLGIISSVIDNVPLVAGAIGMYDFEIDHSFWHQLAFAAGTGGSLLIIGSAAGVAAMSLEKITYSWYFKNISWLALLGYLGAWLYMYYI